MRGAGSREEGGEGSERDEEGISVGEGNHCYDWVIWSKGNEEVGREGGEMLFEEECRMKVLDTGTRKLV